MNISATATRSVLSLACVLGAWLVLATVPAAATIIHQSEGSFNGFDRPAEGSFSGGPFAGFLSSAASDHSSGDVWVEEGKLLGFIGNDLIDKFTAKGEYAGVQITGGATPQGGFSFGFGVFQGIAVDNSASSPHKGDLYVSDVGNGVIDRFSSAGAFECQITARPLTSRSVAEAAAECDGVAGSEVTGTSAIEPAGLAVDSAGDVYVADRANNVIDIFGPSGEYTNKQITNAGLASPAITSPATIAVDSAGNLYVTNYSNNVVEFNASGSFVKVLNEGESAGGVAVDSATNNVYVGIVRENPDTHNSERAFAEYGPTGALFDYFGWTPTGGTGVGYVGLAAGPTGKVYGTEPALFKPSQVFIYSGDIVLPNVTTGVATGPEESNATLHGHVDPDAAHGGGTVTSCNFKFGSTKAYGETAPCTPAPPYSAPQDVSANISGLRPASTYHFRLEAANSDGVLGSGEDETFTTPGPPSIDHASAEALQTTTIFRAHIDPWGYDTDCHVQYVSEETFKSSKWANATTVPCYTQGASGLTEDLGSGFGDVAVKARVSGLARAAVYHWRFWRRTSPGSLALPAAPSKRSTSKKSRSKI